MAKVVAKEFKDEQGRKRIEPIESLIRRFKKKVANEGVLQAIKQKEYYQSRGEKRRLAKEATKRRIQRNNYKQRLREEVVAGKTRLSKTQMRKLGIVIKKRYDMNNNI